MFDEELELEIQFKGTRVNFKYQKVNSYLTNV